MLTLRHFMQFLDIGATRQRRDGRQVLAVVCLAIGLFLIGWIVVWVISLEIESEDIPWRVLVALSGFVALVVSVYVSAPAGNLRRETLGFASGVVGAILLAWLLLYFFVQPDTADERTNVAQIGIAIVAGTIVASGSYVAWRTLALSRERLELDRTSSITENFTAAVEQLGATHTNGGPNYEVRLGGIYALERIANNWIERGEVNDYWAVIEVLTAYLRHNAASRSDTQSATSQGTLSPDVRAIVDVVRRRRGHSVEVESNFRVDLHGVCLPGADFSGAELYEADLSEAILEGAIFSSAYLVKADLSDAHLPNAFLGGARLARANLTKANLTGADLANARLAWANLEDAQMENAYLLEANLEHANLTRARLQGAYFMGASLKDVNLKDAILSGASLWDPYMVKIFPDTSLEGARLDGVDLRETEGVTLTMLLEAKNVDPEKIPDCLHDEYLAMQSEVVHMSSVRAESFDA